MAIERQTQSGYLQRTAEVADATFDSTNSASKTTFATKLAGEDIPNDVMKVEQRYNYTYISTATTTTIKSSAGQLHTITVLGGTAGAVTVYDNTAGSGTVIAAFDSTNAAETYTFDLAFATGLTIVTAAATKVTVTWR